MPGILIFLYLIFGIQGHSLNSPIWLDWLTSELQISAFAFSVMWFQVCVATPGFYVGIGDTNSGLHACMQQGWCFQLTHLYHPRESLQTTNIHYHI